MSLARDLTKSLVRGLAGQALFSLDAFMAAQEDGFWLDFTKTDRHFQENVGATPADGVGEAIGLALDQRSWAGKTLAEILAAQAEILLNGTFDTNTANWTSASSGVLSVNAGKLRIANGAASEGGAQQTPATIAGGMYKLGVDGGSGDTASANVPIEVLGTNLARVGFLKNTHLDRYVIATGSTVTVYPRTNSTTLGQYAEFDNISLKRIPSHHATQATAGAKPVFQAAGAKFDGSDDNLLTDMLASAAANFIVAKITVPATLAGLQIIAGASGASANRIYLSINTAGQLCAGVGSHVATFLVGSQDLRGQTVVVGLTLNGSTVKLFVNGVEEFSTAQGSTPTTAIPFRIGCLNNNGTAANFFAGTIEEILIGREYLTLARFIEIAAKL